MTYTTGCLNKETLEDIKKAREDYKQGKVLTTKQLLRELDAGSL
jgi:hypothetical protein